ncbi:MAG: cupredoxin domain-containing protein [Gemmatimonadota bacterium]
MNPSEMFVLLGAAAAIVWVNWYFFFAGGGSAVASTASSGVQEILVQVQGGYDPARIRVKRGTRVRMVFDRQETSSCSEEVVFPDFGIRKFLPAFEKTAVEFTPEKAGTFDFMCGMSMLRGKLEVEEA